MGDASGSSRADRTTGALHDAHDLLVLDLDGVLYVGADAVPGAVGALEAASTPLAFATNNASRTPEEVAEHLRSLGVPARAEEVMTSSQAGARLVLERLGAAASVLPVGGPGVVAALEEAGLTVAPSPESGPDAVLQGFGRQIGWRELCDVAVAVQGGALWVATNTDLTIPTDRGTMPGNGSLVGAVRLAVDVDPLVAGKPGPVIFTTVVERAGAQRPLVVGDRLDTDIAGAVAAGMPSMLVLTGVSSPRDLLDAPPHQRPAFVGANLAALSDEHLDLATLAAEGADAGEWRWRGALARTSDNALVVDGGSGSTADLLDRLRVAVAACWSMPSLSRSPEPALLALLDDVRRRCAVHP